MDSLGRFLNDNIRGKVLRGHKEDPDEGQDENVEVLYHRTGPESM